MIPEQIARLTPAQLRHEMGGGEAESARRAVELLANRRAEIFRDVCEHYRLRPEELRDVKAPDLAAMIRHVRGIQQVDVAALTAQVGEFLAG